MLEDHPGVDQVEGPRLHGRCADVAANVKDRCPETPIVVPDLDLVDVVEREREAEGTSLFGGKKRMPAGSNLHDLPR